MEIAKLLEPEAARQGGHTNRGQRGPKTIIKDIASPLLQLSNLDYLDAAYVPLRVREMDVTGPASLAKAIVELEKQMKSAAKQLEFEEAAAIRDRIKELRAQQIYKT
jgi:excinuclease ABC subunit B